MSGISPPWGIYSASNYSDGILYDSSGNNRNAICSGVTLGNSSGNGASVSIPYLYGSTSSTIDWPTGSIPANFTICSITRYTGHNNKQRILRGTNKNFLHGHWGAGVWVGEGRAGVAVYNSEFKTNTPCVIICKFIK